MYLLKNAIKSITRNKGRNILIIVIVAVIAGACAVTLSIRNSATNIVKAYEEKYDLEASISMDRNSLMEIIRGEDGKNDQEAMIEAYKKIDKLTVDKIKEYGNSVYVDSFYYEYNINMDGKNLTKATDRIMKETTETKTQTETKKYGNFGGTPPEGRPGMPNRGNSNSGTQVTKKTTTKVTTQIIGSTGGDFTVKGYSSYESMKDFIDGKYKMSSGIIFEDFESENCVISKELADLNKVAVGDKITLVNPSNTKKTYEVTVTGIFEENSDSSNDMSNMFSDSANTIITNAAMVEKILKDDTSLGTTITPTFILNSKEGVEGFTNEVKEKGLSDYYTITTNLEEITSGTKSITNVKTFATTFLTITLAIGGVVLLVLNSLTIRERKYEIGVLRTIGMKKTSVITQFVLELLIVSTIGLCIGAVGGSFTSVPVANSLLQTEINNSKTEIEDIDRNFGGDFRRPDRNRMGNIAKIEEVDSIEAVMDLKVLAQLLGIGLLLTVISSLSACISIARFQPLTILKERS